MYHKECPICDGVGGWDEDVGLEYCCLYTSCPYCESTGKISFKKWVGYLFWNEYAPDWLFDLIVEITHWKEIRKQKSDEKQKRNSSNK